MIISLTREVSLATVVGNIVDLGVQVSGAIVVTILNVEAGLAIIKSQGVHVGVDITTATVVDVGAKLAILLGLSLDVHVVVGALLHADADLATIKSLDIRVQGNIIILDSVSQYR